MVIYCYYKKIVAGKTKRQHRRTSRKHCTHLGEGLTGCGLGSGGGGDGTGLTGSGLGSGGGGEGTGLVGSGLGSGDGEGTGGAGCGPAMFDVHGK